MVTVPARDVARLLKQAEEAPRTTGSVETEKKPVEETAKKKPRKDPWSPTVAIGSTAPGFELVDQAGKTHTLESYKGKYVLLDWWGIW